MAFKPNRPVKVRLVILLVFSVTEYVVTLIDWEDRCSNLVHYRIGEIGYEAALLPSEWADVY